MVGGRDTPPSVQDGPYGYEPDSVSYFDRDPRSSDILDAVTAQKLGREMYESSTNWLNSGRRARWADSLRAFQNRHPAGSKYLTRDYAYRSDLYRPKTRSMVRNDEAQTASAFFANEDVVSIRPGDEDDLYQVASADLMQQLLQYRLTRNPDEGGIPWFLTLIGARQDAEVMGICIANAGWKYEEGFSHSVQMQSGPVDIMQKSMDRPYVNLLAPENFRFEPGADWRDVVSTSPYLIEMIPMYIQDVRERMDAGEWNDVSESAIRTATDRDDDTTRRSRELGRVPGKDHDSWKPMSFDIAWVHRNIVKWKGRDWNYYTLGEAGELLTDPVPLEEVELHGVRPYVVGFVVLETHKTYPASKVELTADLQRATNDDWNLRFDNVKLCLNPRQFVKTGHGIEQQDLLRFAPGKLVMVTGTKDEPIANNIITWDRPPPPDQSAYAEQDRINLDWDELTGAFTNSSIQASQIQQQSATGMHLMSGIASGMNEYELRVFAETFVEPLIRLLVKLEQAYETDPVILALAGRNAQLFQKFGLNEITDELLNQELTTRVNVGIGATNPSMKMRNLVAVGQALGQMFGPIAAQAANFEEIAKELFGLAGYKDGSRFLKPGFDPQVAMLQQQLQKAQGQGRNVDPSHAAAITAQGRIQEQQLKNQGAMQAEQAETQRTHITEQSEMWREWIKAQADAHAAGTEHAHKMAMGHLDRAARQAQQNMQMPTAASFAR